MGARSLLLLCLAASSHALHPRNAFKGTYDMPKLISACPSLAPHIVPAQSSKGGRDTINFADPAAVRCINKAILAADYGIHEWDLPEGKLCPPIPGRADYIHYMADVLAFSAGSKSVPRGPSVCAMDIGTGSSLIYPLIGVVSYGWSFIASECDIDATESARRILTNNRNVKGLTGVDIRFQKSPNKILSGIWQPGEKVDFVMCNPPFYESPEAFQAASQRKRDNLETNVRKRSSAASLSGQRAGSNMNSKQSSASGRAGDRGLLDGGRATGGSNNFGGQNAELWCPGGEVSFVQALAKESRVVRYDCLWFSSLISQASNLSKIRDYINKMAGVQVIKQIEMGQGSKKSSVLLWSYLSRDEHREWGRRRGWEM